MLLWASVSEQRKRKAIYAESDILDCRCSPRRPHQVGVPILVTVTVTNISGTDAAWPSERGQNGAYKEFGYLLTKDGREVETTFFHRRITGRQRPDDPLEVESGSTILLLHPPGVMFRFKIDLKRLYEIQEPGVYTLEATLFDDYSKTKVHSNKLTLKIASQGRTGPVIVAE
jgi:hypothetical protein